MRAIRASNGHWLTEIRWLRGGVMPVGQASTLLQQFAERSTYSKSWVSNVAGEEVAQHIRKIGINEAAIHFVVSQEYQCGVRNGYSNAAQLGSDRWAALIAAWHLVKGKCLVVSMRHGNHDRCIVSTGRIHRRVDPARN